MSPAPLCSSSWAGGVSWVCSEPDRRPRARKRTVLLAADGARFEPASFRDCEGRVFERDGNVYRALSASALEDWRALRDTRFFPEAVDAGQIVATEEVAADEIDLAGLEGGPWVAALRHERVELLSYPAEWSFGMLKQAALLHLDLFLAALDEGFVVKDSSAYNVQWRGTEPVFIDVPSFQKAVPGEPWIGYLQFCEQFLYPLLLTARCDVPFHAWLRGSLEGIGAQEMNRLLGPLDRLRPSLFGHVYLQAKLAGATAAKPQAIRAEVRDLGFGIELIRNNVRRMRKLVGRLEWRRAESEWSSYSSCHNYEPEERRQKEAFVERAAQTGRWRELWDLGANTGHFTRLAAAHAERTVALDIDPLVVDLTYRKLVEEGNPQRILPLVTDLLDPFSDRGWRGVERKGLFERAQPDLLLALALVHHLVIGRNVPMAQVLDWLAGFGAHLVIELPTREDSMVERLLLNRDEHVQEYSLESFERLLGERFELLEREPLARGARVLYFAAPLG